uniref:Transmembrane protein n=1 Tax=Steinernema glaseri TaxID=37863 RepID=A0A1I7YR21_9BILA
MSFLNLIKLTSKFFVNLMKKKKKNNEFRPSEPYLFLYQNEYLNISGEVLNGEVYPFWTYSYLVALVPVFLLTDLLLYKPVLLLESISFIAVWLLMIFGRAVWTQQLSQICYGWATATEIAYFSYIYVKVEKKKFERVTSYRVYARRPANWPLLELLDQPADHPPSLGHLSHPQLHLPRESCSNRYLRFLSSTSQVAEGVLQKYGIGRK